MFYTTASRIYRFLVFIWISIFSTLACLVETAKSSMVTILFLTRIP